MKNKSFLIILYFISFNILLTLLIGIPYFTFVGKYPLEVSHTIIAYLSNTFSIYILLTTIFIFIYYLKFPKIIYITMFSIINILFIADVGIYKIFRFHINGFTLNTILTKGGWESLEFNITTKIFIILTIILVFILEYLVYNRILKIIEKKEILLNQKKVFLSFLFILFIILLDKGIYAYADLRNISYITRHSKLFPLYQPLTINKFAHKYLNIRKQNTVRIKLDKRYSGLNYPKNKLLNDNKKGKGLPNIIWIFSDSFRYDMFNKEVTPNIYNFSKKALVFKNHYSGGNCTRFGVFSIFYGLHGYYWNSILGERQAPVFISSLMQLGYEFRILASAELTFPEFDKTCFIDIPLDSIYDKPPGETKSDKDKAISDKFIQYIAQKEDKKPFFSFIFLDCPHGSYDFPEKFEKFKPTVATFNYLLLNKRNIYPVFNRYRNAIYYNDYLIGNIIKAIEKKGILENTILLISADHGEAFFEKGFYGHNHGFCEEQIKVPLIMHIPGYKHKEYSKLTSHNDIIPTIFPFLGYNNEAGDYSQGQSLLKNDRRDFILCSSWDEMALVNAEYTAIIPFETYNMRRVKVYDLNYREINNKDIEENLSVSFIKNQKEIMSFFK